MRGARPPDRRDRGLSDSFSRYVGRAWRGADALAQMPAGRRQALGRQRDSDADRSRRRCFGVAARSICSPRQKLIEAAIRLDLARLVQSWRNPLSSAARPRSGWGRARPAAAGGFLARRPLRASGFWPNWPSTPCKARGAVADLFCGAGGLRPAFWRPITRCMRSRSTAPRSPPLGPPPRTPGLRAVTAEARDPVPPAAGAPRNQAVRRSRVRSAARRRAGPGARIGGERRSNHRRRVLQRGKLRRATSHTHRRRLPLESSAD